MNDKKIISPSTIFIFGCIAFSAIQILSHAVVLSWIDWNISIWINDISPYYSLSHPVRTQFIFSIILVVLSAIEIFTFYKIYKMVIAKPENNKDSVRLFFGVKAVITILLAIFGIVVAGFHM